MKKPLKKISKELLKDVIEILASGQMLPEKYKDHNLTGNYYDCRECHITPDWLLIYKINNNELILYLTRTGTHSDLF
ncbi:MAG: type II toxin-antitoxin system YafQ family toxin [Ruminococcus sp.]|nr:type II toxin-antitoxin system YafQ family toxin [Ruminococcus sp.]